MKFSFVVGLGARRSLVGLGGRLRRLLPTVFCAFETAFRDASSRACSLAPLYLGSRGASPLSSSPGLDSLVRLTRAAGSRTGSCFPTCVVCTLLRARGR